MFVAARARSPSRAFMAALPTRSPMGMPMNKSLTVRTGQTHVKSGGRTICCAASKKGRSTRPSSTGSVGSAWPCAGLVQPWPGPGRIAFPPQCHPRPRYGGPGGAGPGLRRPRNRQRLVVVVASKGCRPVEPCSWGRVGHCDGAGGLSAGQSEAKQCWAGTCLRYHNDNHLSKRRPRTPLCRNRFVDG